jgi:hypothetical protein
MKQRCYRAYGGAPGFGLLWMLVAVACSQKITHLVFPLHTIPLALLCAALIAEPQMGWCPTSVQLATRNEAWSLETSAGSYMLNTLLGASVGRSKLFGSRRVRIVLENVALDILMSSADADRFVSELSAAWSQCGSVSQNTNPFLLQRFRGVLAILFGVGPVALFQLLADKVYFSMPILFTLALLGLCRVLYNVWLYRFSSDSVLIDKAFVVPSKLPLAPGVREWLAACSRAMSSKHEVRNELNDLGSG